MGKDFKSKNGMLRKCQTNCFIRDVGFGEVHSPKHFSRTEEGEKGKGKEKKKIARRRITGLAIQE